MRHKGRYISLALGTFAAVEILINAAIKYGYDIPTPNPLKNGEWIVREYLLNKQQWRDFIRRPDVYICLTYVFVIAGPTTTLASDFNILSNTISAIGSGGPGAGGVSGVCGITGGGAGGGGAFSSITNYSGHTAGQSVNVQVGASDTWFDSTSILLAKEGLAGAGQNAGSGGLASSGVGTVKHNGGNGGAGGLGFPGCCLLQATGGGGGGAGGPHGDGSNGANGITDTTGSANGGDGGAGDSGTTAGGIAGTGNGPAGANGTQFDSSHGIGGGGAGGGSTSVMGGNGGNGGSYGAGAGGGGTGNCAQGNGGNAFQGLIAIAYTPASAGGAHSFGFIIS